MIHHRPQTLITRCLLLLALGSLPLALAFGQSSTATLSGTVTDPNGAVVPGVKVTITDPATRLQRETTTNESGQFVVPLLPPSTYNLTLEHAGFMTAVVNDIVLNVNDNRALNIQMKVGDVSETVNVTGEASLMSESPAVATVIEREFIGNLPLNGRTFQSLIKLTPGVVLTKSTLGNEGQFSVNGQRANANYFTVDGVSANASAPSTNVLGQSAGSLPGLSAFGSTNNLVSVDAIQEFKIQTSTYAAEFGRTPGAQVQILSRSGTNQFHGTIFEYLRNEVLDANDWFNNARRLRKPALRQNDFGGVLGGPIIKNQTFFFFSYEGLRLRLPQSAAILVPSISARQAAPPLLQPFLNAYPVPTGPENPANRFAPFSASYSDPSTLNSTSIRADHAVNNRITIFGRYSYAPSDSERRANNLSEIDRTISATQFLTLGLTHHISGTVINELRANYTHNKAGVRYRLDNFGGATVPASATLLPSLADADASLLIFQITGLPPFFFGRNVVNVQRQTNIVDNLSVVAGMHQLKFGVDYRRLSPIIGPQEYNQTVSFSGLLGNRGVLSGVARQVNVGAQDSVTLIFKNFSAYGQDTWRMNDRLTLTLGLRWEVNTPPQGRGDQDLFAVQGLANPATLSLAPQGTPLWNTTHNNFAPRIGAAYQLFRDPSRETVLRGGFGIFYDLGEGASAQGALNFPYNRRKVLSAATGFTSGVPYPLDPALAQPPAFTLNPPFGAFNAFDPNLKLPRTYQWNFSLDQSLGTNQLISISYVGAAGRRLLRQELLQFPNANFGVVSVVKNTATSDYNALQLQFQRRMSKGVQFLTSYTWSKSIDTVSTDLGQDPPDTRINIDHERGPSDFDVRHAFNAAITYNIPTPRLGAFGSAILRDWSLDTIFTARSALPVNVTYVAFNSFAATAGVALRPDLVPGVPLYISDANVAGRKRINGSAFTIGSIERQGTLGRNSVRGFPVSQMDFAVRRQFKLTERFNLQFRAEFFNVFNHPNFGDPNPTDFSSVLGFVAGGPLTPLTPFFGQSTAMLGRSLGTGGTGGGLNPLYQIGGPRSIQFGLKLQF